MIFLIIFALINICACVPFRYHTDVGIKHAQYLMVQEKIGRIIGGQRVPSIVNHPYQAGLVITLTNRRTSICGGAIISNTRVLTAAHCWSDGENQARSVEVVLGSLTIFTGGTRITTTDIAVHPSWNDKDIINDIAVLRISRIQFGQTIRAIQLPTGSDVNNAFAGVMATVTGFGKTSDSQTSFPRTTSLYQVNLNVLSNAMCQRSFSDVKLLGSHLCTDGSKKVGTCVGDSGGPLTATVNNRQILIGIVSFGLGDGCELGTPSVYSRVTAFLPWINQQL